MRNLLNIIIMLLALSSLTGCWLLAGAGATGGAYEYQNKKQLDELEKDFGAGNITREEYLKRKQQIQEGSVIY